MRLDRYVFFVVVDSHEEAVALGSSFVGARGVRGADFYCTYLLGWLGLYLFSVSFCCCCCVYRTSTKKKAYRYLYEQDPSAWTQELDLRYVIVVHSLARVLIFGIVVQKTE